MITECESYHALSDQEKQNEAFAKMSAARKAALTELSAPHHVVQANGLDLPHRPLHTGETYETAHTAVCGSGTDKVRVHYCQDVREDFPDAFGSFGAADDTEDDVVWTAFDVGNDSVMMKVVGDWKDRREISHEEFARNYDPIVLETSEGEEIPQFGY